VRHLQSADPNTRRYAGFILWGLGQGLVASFLAMWFVLTGERLPVHDYRPFVVIVLVGGFLAAIVFYPLRGKPLRLYWLGFPIVSALLPWVIFEASTLMTYGRVSTPGLGGFDLLIPLAWSLPLIALSLVWCLGLYLWRRIHRIT
jgi:hypothetical protein